MSACYGYYNDSGDYAAEYGYDGSYYQNYGSYNYGPNGFYVGYYVGGHIGDLHYLQYPDTGGYALYYGQGYSGSYYENYYGYHQS